MLIDDGWIQGRLGWWWILPKSGTIAGGLSLCSCSFGVPAACCRGWSAGVAALV